MTAKLVVLCSGSGTNLQAILEACDNQVLAARVVAVFSNKSEAYGLVRASRAGIPAISFPKQLAETRQEYDGRLAQAVARYEPDYVVLAGWMRLLSNVFLAAFPRKVINLHPALPGMFPGVHAIERAYQACQQGEIDHSGVMVHFVPDEGVDNGPILAVQQITFLPGEALEEFEARVHAVEHRLLVDAIKQLVGDDRP